jgi:hypothetical protein
MSGRLAQEGILVCRWRLQVEAGKCRCGGVRRRGCRWSSSSLRQGASQGSRVASERVMGVQDWWLQDGGLG